MSEKEIILEMIKLLQEMLFELNANDCDTPKNLINIAHELEDIKERFKNEEK